MAQLWLIGGTQESRQIVAALHRQGTLPPMVVTVTRDSARRLYLTHPRLKVWVGHLGADGADAFLQDHAIGAILDASHPFAAEISHLAIALAQRQGLPYLRYERAPVADGALPPDHQGRPGLVCLSDWAELLQPQYLTPGDRTLITTGTRRLADLAPWQTRTTLFVRILPQPEAIAAALTAGFDPARVVALRPPISADLEAALWQQWRITQVVTKASGAAGGEPHKRQLAAQLGVRLVVITRPPVPYPHQTNDLAAAIAFARHPHSPAT